MSCTPPACSTSPSTKRLPSLSFPLRVDRPKLSSAPPPATPKLANKCTTMMTMRGRSFSYHKLKKLPHAAAGAGPHTTAAALEQADRQDQRQQPPSPSAIQESYRSYYRALARGRRQQQQGGGGARRRRRPRLRISRLARAVRRRAAAVGASVRVSVARVARRLLHEGRPYIGDLFAGNYMFMQVAPSPITAATAPGDGKGGFADYYYATLAARSKAAAGVLYKV